MATLTISDNLLKQIQKVAIEQQRPVEDVLSDAVTLVAQKGKTPMAAPRSREEEQLLIREAMKGRIWTEEDVEAYFEGLDLPPMSDDEAECIVASIPPLDPPLSQTVIQLRNEERY